jgi:phosphatidylglycerol:prolipoprotein diacylglycerol transferase
MDFQQQHILIGNLQIRYYGIIVVFAMLVGAWLAARLAERRKLNPDHIWGGLTWAIFPGIIGARLWFVLFPPISLSSTLSRPFC